MDNFTRGISNLTGPDPNRIFIGTEGTAPENSKKKSKKSKKSKKKSRKKSKKKSRKSEKPKVCICPSKEETVAFSNDVLKFIQKRLKPGAGVVIVAGVSPVGLPIIKVGIGRVDNITTAYEFESDNPFVDLKVRMNQARVSLDISNDG